LTVKPQSAAIGTHENQNWSYDSTNTGVEFDLKLKQVVSSGLVKYKFDLRNSGTSYDNNLVLDRGNVGIGESNPSTRLDVSTNAGNGNAGQLVKVTNTNTSSGTAKTLTIGTDNYFASNPGMTVVAESGLSFGVGDGSDLAAQRDLVINASGSVGIGVTDPQHSLDINTGATTRVKTGDGTRSLISGVWGSQPRIQASGADLDITAVGSNAITMQTNGTERMRIDSSGNLQLGITSGSNRRLYLRASANNSTNYACQMENSGAQNLFFVRSDGAFNTGEGTSSPYNNTTAAAANLNVSSNGFLGRSTSSIRYKENVRDYTGSIDALRPVMFNSINEDDDKDYAGFIAEEVHETGLVEFVQYDDQGRPDAVNYANMVALLVKEIQDLKAEVAALKGA
jgi:hypothetical protein